MSHEMGEDGVFELAFSGHFLNSCDLLGHGLIKAEEQ